MLDSMVEPEHIVLPQVWWHCQHGLPCISLQKFILGI